MPRSLSRTALLFPLSVLLLACSGGGGGGGGGNGGDNGGNGAEPPPAALVVELRLDPVDTTVPAGSTRQFSATAVYDDNTSADVTAQAEWSTSAQGIAEFVNAGNGIVRGLLAGETAVTAAYGEATATARLTVIPGDIEDLEVDPQQLALAAGETAFVTATASFAGGVTHDVTLDAEWTSDDESVAVVESDADTVRVRGEMAGSTSIHADVGGVRRSLTVEVGQAALTGIAVEADSTSLNQGALLQLSATATFSDNQTRDVTAQVSWSSGDTDRLSIVGSTVPGVVAGLEPGTVEVTATMGGVTGALTLEVISAPGEPRHLVLFANPNVILSDGQDSTTLTAVVTSNDPEQVVADGRVVEFATLPGEVLLSAAERQTVSAQAEVTATAGQAGVELALARVPGTLASGAAWLLKVDGFADVIFGEGRLFEPPDVEARTLAFMVINLSNRTFGLVSIEAFEGDELIGGVDDVAELQDGQLGGGEELVVYLVENDDFDFDGLDLENVHAVFRMSDAATGQTFDVRVDTVIE